MMFVNELMCLQHGCEEGWATLFLCEVQIIFKEESCWFDYFTSRIELQFLLKCVFHRAD